MNPEPRPSKMCHGCLDYEECPCACHIVGNLMGEHHHFNSVPESLTGITSKILKQQLRKRNGI